MTEVHNAFHVTPKMPWVNQMELICILKILTEPKLKLYEPAVYTSKQMHSYFKLMKPRRDEVKVEALNEFLLG